MDRLSKADRKSRIAVWKDEERAKARDAFPFDDHVLENFFEQLEQRLESERCSHNTVIAETVARGLGLDEAECERLFTWCESEGGFCDCEIVLNTFGHWQENRRRAL
jgi:hypothetical protein